LTVPEEDLIFDMIILKTSHPCMPYSYPICDDEQKRKVEAEGKVVSP